MAETVLNLSYQRLDQIPDYVFEKHYRTLQKLDLGKKKLKPLPLGFGNLLTELE